MKKLLYLISLVMFITTLGYADYYKDSLILNPDTLNQKISQDIDENQIENPLFIYAGAGVTYIDVKSSVQANKLAGELSKNAGIAEVGLGLRVDKNIFFTAFMQKAYLSKVDITNIGISTNYQIDSAYVGLLGGQSSLVWEKSPLINTTSEVKSQKQVFYGFQFGYDYELLYRLSLYTKYQLMILNHQTNINSDSTIKHNIQNNLTTGVKYAF